MCHRRLLASAAVVGALLLSAEALALLPPPAHLRVTPFYSTAWVQWDVLTDPSVAGYNVYRHIGAAGGRELVKRVLVRGQFTDCHLAPGENYYYSVAAIDGAGNVISETTAEVGTTLLTSAAGLSTHKNFEILVVFYTTGYTQQQVTALTGGVKKGMEFYWRTSGCRFNFDATWMYIATPLPGSDWYDPALQADLRSRGVQDNQYDLGYLIGQDLPGCLGGYLVFGGMCASLGTVCGVPYPGQATNGFDPTIMWTFTHEIHHALELMGSITGMPTVVWCHFSDGYPSQIGANGWHLPLGPHFGGIAALNRDYGNKWMMYPPPYDGYLECFDTDGDGLPNRDSRVPFGELPPNALNVDTDADGFTDLQEYSAYNFKGTDSEQPGHRWRRHSGWAGWASAVRLPQRDSVCGDAARHRRDARGELAAVHDRVLLLDEPDVSARDIRGVGPERNVLRVQDGPAAAVHDLAAGQAGVWAVGVGCAARRGRSGYKQQRE